MSNRELVMHMLEKMSDYKIGYALAYIQGLMTDEEADDFFCERMLEAYENDPDPEKDTVCSLEELKSELKLA